MFGSRNRLQSGTYLEKSVLGIPKECYEESDKCVNAVYRTVPYCKGRGLQHIFDRYNKAAAFRVSIARYNTSKIIQKIT